MIHILSEYFLHSLDIWKLGVSFYVVLLFLYECDDVPKGFDRKFLQLFVIFKHEKLAVMVDHLD